MTWKQGECMHVAYHMGRQSTYYPISKLIYTKGVAYGFSIEYVIRQDYFYLCPLGWELSSLSKTLETFNLLAKDHLFLSPLR
jgi:hypothetical protein